MNLGNEKIQSEEEMVQVIWDETDLNKKVILIENFIDSLRFKAKIPHFKQELLKWKDNSVKLDFMVGNILLMGKGCGVLRIGENKKSKRN